jgi:hypothetical protein
MKKSTVVVLLILVAVVSSAATLGVQKLIAVMNAPEGLIILTDARCEQCDTARIEGALKMTFPGAPVEVVDYGQRKGSKLYDEEGIENLPAVLVPKAYDQKEEFKRFERMAKLGKGYYVLPTGGSFDPKAEICDNEKDDNGDKLVDCSDPTCKKDWRCMEKLEKPKVDVFVMSHCPFGTQIEKGLLPVWDALGDKIDLKIRYVDYAMHGEKEINEQLRQYCVAQQGMGKLRTYLGCFLEAGEEGDACVKKAGVEADALKACIAKTDEQYGVSKGLKDQTKWKGRFPPFPIDAELVQKYGVKGSPALVVNDVMVESGRSPKAIRDAICKGFKEPPPECTKEMDDASPSPGFGMGKAQDKGQPGAGAGAACGG